MMRNSRLGSDRGAALPLVIMMVVLLTLAMTAVGVLTASGHGMAAASASGTAHRSARVSAALQASLRDLTPASGRLLGIDPGVDPAGSCTGQLGPYAAPDGHLIAVDCAQATNSGWETPLSSVLLLGTPNDCGTDCVTGRDGGLLVNSNEALQFSGSVVNLSGAWWGKNANANILQVVGDRATVIQPAADGSCPAGAYADATGRCVCPSIIGSGICISRTLQSLQADTTRFRERVGEQVAAVPVTGVAVIPDCSAATKRGGLWVLDINGGIVGINELAKLNALTNGGCVGDGSEETRYDAKHKPYLVTWPVLEIHGALRFQGAAGTAMSPGNAASTSNTWIINSNTAVVIGGTAPTNASAGAVLDCDTGTTGASFQFAGATYMRLTAGHLYLCAAGELPVFVAPTATDGAGFAWAGAKADSVFATQYGLSSGELLKAHGLVYAPAGFFAINSQSNRTQVSLEGGAVLRALTLVANQSTSMQGTFTAPAPSPNGVRRVQLRFRDLTAALDLGAVQIDIFGDYPLHPASGYAIKVWRTMW